MRNLLRDMAHPLTREATKDGGPRHRLQIPDAANPDRRFAWPLPDFEAISGWPSA